MTTDRELLEMAAKAAGIKRFDSVSMDKRFAGGIPPTVYQATPEKLQAFAALVRNAAMEEAADVINRVDLGGLNDHPREQKLLADTLVLLKKLIRTLKESGK